MSLIEDAWLARQLGRPVFRLKETLPDPLPDGLIVAKVPVAETGLEPLIARGFRLVATAVTFECPIPMPVPRQAAAGIRMARPDDEEAIGRVARQSFVFDHFHGDPAIPRDAADRLKEAWARNFFADARGDWMVVAEREGEVAGFLLLMDSGGKLVIDLIAVDESSRGAGLATAMIAFAARELDGYRTMRVSTQLGNVPSVRLYEAMGFRLVEAQHVLHYDSRTGPGGHA